MNARAQAVEQAKVMLAFADGMEIEFNRFGCADDNWRISESPHWNWSVCDYRIAKPKSRKVEKWQWVIQFKGCPQTLSPYFRSEREVADYHPSVVIIQRADWTRIEVGE